MVWHLDVGLSFPKSVGSLIGGSAVPLGMVSLDSWILKDKLIHFQMELEYFPRWSIGWNCPRWKVFSFLSFSFNLPTLERSHGFAHAGAVLYFCPRWRWRNLKSSPILKMPTLEDLPDPGPWGPSSGEIAHAGAFQAQGP